MTKIEKQVKIDSLGNQIFTLNGKIMGAYAILNADLIKPLSKQGNIVKDMIKNGENDYIDLHTKLDKLEKGE